MEAVTPIKIIGAVTRYLGTEHAYLQGHMVRIVAVHRGVLNSPDDYQILRDDEAIAAAGGVDADADIVEVVPVHPDGRVSWVTSNACVGDLKQFSQE